MLVCVCRHACVCVYTCLCVYVYACVCMRMCVVCVYACMYVCVCMCVCVCVCRFFCLTTDGLVYCKSKTDPPKCNIPAEDMLAVERVDENAFNMKHVCGGCVWRVWSLCGMWAHLCGRCIHCVVFSVHDYCMVGVVPMQ